MSFKENFEALCFRNGKSPTFVCQAIGLSNAAYSKWTDETIPHKATLVKFADYFGVSVDYLLGKEQKEKPTIQTNDELLILNLYNRLSESDQLAVKTMLESLLQKPEYQEKENVG